MSNKIKNGIRKKMKGRMLLVERIPRINARGATT